MKKYTRPELSISKFDVEDIITASGQYGSAFETGTLYTDNTLTTEAQNVDTSAVVYFNW